MLSRAKYHTVLAGFVASALASATALAQEETTMPKDPAHTPSAEQQAERHAQPKERASGMEARTEEHAAGMEAKPKEHAAGMEAEPKARAAGMRDTEEARETRTDAREQVDEAAEVVAQMKSDPKLMELLQAAHGVYIVPDYGQAAAVVGGRGGEGVLLIREQDKWSSPAFYNFGRISIGAQAGASGGQIAMLLMSDKAVQPFKTEKNNFSLDATAGLTIVDYSKDARAELKNSDVVVWSDTEGLFAGASLGISGIRRDDEENRSYYKREATPQEIFSGVVNNPHAQTLRDALPDRVATAR